MNFPRPTKEKHTMGKKRSPHSLRYQIPLKSKKQIRREIELKKKFKQILREYELRGIRPHCQKCCSTTRKLFADHVLTRNGPDADRYSNLGLLCWLCNGQKGSVREEYRQPWFIKRMAELDEEVRKIEEGKRING